MLGDTRLGIDSAEVAGKRDALVTSVDSTAVHTAMAMSMTTARSATNSGTEVNVEGRLVTDVTRAVGGTAPGATHDAGDQVGRQQCSGRF